MTASSVNAMQLAGSIVGWYVCSSILVSSNKLIFDIMDLPVPLMVTFVHFSTTSFVMVLLKHKFPDLIGRNSISRSEFVRWILPIAVCTAGDVGLSNMSYSRLPISVITVLKSSAPVCIYMAAVFARVERFQWRLCLVCAGIAISVACAMPSREEQPTEFDFVSGTIIILSAMVCLSIRWVLIQSLSRRYTPLELMFFIQPMSALGLLPFVLGFEASTSLTFNWLAFGIVLASAFAAMGLLLFEYRIVHFTTSLTLSIAGIGKEVLTLFLSALVFSEKFSLRQILCISASIAGIMVYSVIRKREIDDPAQPSLAKPSFVLVPDADKRRSLDRSASDVSLEGLRLRGESPTTDTSPNLA